MGELAPEEDKCREDRKRCVSYWLSESLIDRISDYRYQHRLPSEVAAVRELLDKALTYKQECG